MIPVDRTQELFLDACAAQRDGFDPEIVSRISSTCLNLLTRNPRRGTTLVSDIRSLF